LIGLIVVLMLAWSGAASAATTPYTVTLTLSPASIPAGGVATTATAIVTDANGAPVPGDTVVFTSSDPGEEIATPSAVTDGNGMASTVIASSSAVGQATITATDQSGNSPAPATQTLTQTRPAANVSVSLSNPLVAAGTGSTTATVTVTDSGTNPVPNDPITIAQPGGPTTLLGLTDASGTVSGQLTATSALGPQTITASDGSAPAIRGSATLTQYGAPATILIGSISSGPLTAGQSASVTATVSDASGDPVPLDPSLEVGWGGATAAMIPGSTPGTYTGNSPALTAAGTDTVVVADGIATPGSGQVTVVAGPAAQISPLSLSPALVPVGSGTTTATVTISDAYGNPVAGEIVTLTGPPPTSVVTTMPPTDASGTTSAPVRASGAEGQQPVTVSDVTQNNGTLTSTAVLTQYGAPATITIQSASPSSLTAGQTAVITASVADAVGDPVPADSLNVTWNGTSVLMASAPTPGSYTGTTPPLTLAGADTVVVSDALGAVPGTATFSVVHGPPAALHLSGGFVPSSIPADHNSSASIQVKVADTYGNGIAGQTLSVSSNDPGQAISWTDNGGGIYTITVRSSYTPVSSTVSIADGAQSAQATLGQTSAATGIGLSLGAGTLTADGRSNTLATITLHNQYGAPLPGDAHNLQLTPSDPHLGIGHITDLGNGDYTATVTSSVVAHLVSLTASETAMHLKASTGLTLVPGAPAELSVQVAPGVLTANGLATAALALTLADAHGNPIAGAVPQLRATPAGLHFGRLSDLGGGRYAGTVRASNVPGTITVSARDGAAVGATTLTEMTAPSELATASMQWSFHFTRSYTSIIALNLTGAPVGSKIIEICRGHGGCPFRRRVAARVRPVHCTKARHRACHNVPGGVDIMHGLRLRRLRPGTVLIVQIVRRGWIGKYYAFTFRGGQAPLIMISCLAPGGSRPGAGCQ
jgi:adhesin/invasin